MAADLPELTPGPQLSGLIRACQKMCVADCCGVDAFDFSPLHVASYLAAWTGAISEPDMAAIHEEIEQLRAAALACTPDADGRICSVQHTNQLFTRESLAAALAQIESSVQLAPQVLEFADRLREDAT